jgi:hypothetical protein
MEWDSLRWDCVVERFLKEMVLSLAGQMEENLFKDMGRKRGRQIVDIKSRKYGALRKWQTVVCYWNIRCMK